MAAAKIFISMGTPYNQNSTVFRSELESFLRNECGVDPRIIGRNEYPDGNPLPKIKSVMESCSGVIVVAYERKYVSHGVIKRTGEAPKDVTDIAYTTPWNHVESAMAYCMDLPIFILCQEDLEEECLIESKIDWYVQYIKIAPGAISSEDTAKHLKSWINNRVLLHRKKGIFRSINGNIPISELTLEEIWGMIGLVAGSFGLGAASMQFFPRLFGK